MGTYHVKRVDRLSRRLAEQCGAVQVMAGPIHGRVPKPGGRAWLAFDEPDVVVGFTAVRRARRTVHIENCVVLPHARGNRLQLRMFRSVIAWALCDLPDVESIRTYTAADNWYSAANIVDCGFKVLRIANDNGGPWVEWERVL